MTAPAHTHEHRIAAATAATLHTVALKPDVFEGMRFEITRPLNQNFFLTHRCAIYAPILRLPAAVPAE
jgi:hypothetical protein